MSSIFEKHESPKHEQSIWKNIPIEKLEYVRGILKKVTYCTGNQYKIRYRGPRHDWMSMTCLKRNARTFSVYYK